MHVALGVLRWGVIKRRRPTSTFDSDDMELEVS